MANCATSTSGFLVLQKNMNMHQKKAICQKGPDTDNEACDNDAKNNILRVSPKGTPADLVKFVLVPLVDHPVDCLALMCRLVRFSPLH
jgi:hypothetical protein